MTKFPITRVIQPLFDMVASPPSSDCPAVCPAWSSHEEHTSTLTQWCCFPASHFMQETHVVIVVGLTFTEVH